MTEIVSSIKPRSSVKRWRFKRRLAVAVCRVSGIAFLYLALILIIAGTPSLVFLGLLPTIICFIVGRRIRIGRRRTILYLRRFHSPDRQLRKAIAWGLEHRYRVVTLDDGMMAPARMPVSDIIIALLTGALWGALIGLMARFLELGFEPAATNPALQVWNVLETAMFVVPGFGIGLLVGIVRIIAVQWKSRVRVKERNQLDKLSSVLRRLSGGGLRPNYLIPRLLVISVADDFWQEAVTIALSKTICCVIDVSEPTASLLWEVDCVIRTIGRPAVFTANADSLRRWMSDVESGGTEEASALKARLKNHSILAYDKGGAWRLGRHLTSAFDNALSAAG